MLLRSGFRRAIENLPLELSWKVFSYLPASFISVLSSRYENLRSVPFIRCWIMEACVSGREEEVWILLNALLRLKKFSVVRGILDGELPKVVKMKNGRICGDFVIASVLNIVLMKDDVEAFEELDLDYDRVVDECVSVIYDGVVPCSCHVNHFHDLVGLFLHYNAYNCWDSLVGYEVDLIFCFKRNILTVLRNTDNHYFLVDLLHDAADLLEEPVCFCSNYSCVNCKEEDKTDLFLFCLLHRKYTCASILLLNGKKIPKTAAVVEFFEDDDKMGLFKKSFEKVADMPFEEFLKSTNFSF